ncbi:pyrroloquinoline quinone biosynthesis protein PqqB [Streptomyces sp. KM273126]|uniref:pyrroloquinoline quinone biosynthesis protein PqqB n=1 Tax=Streptomyces sp. KM273126 TaxID=2545247 RepID=UPI00103AE9E8|nr:pyrroloquinoline quinone biosynthesis protein PqqB [Streptomyces sp. KM273126]MBA2812970.1 pyrroloquinoline quinone biosynthesis protein PqqB [Streptomyces sp. KM273126]
MLLQVLGTAAGGGVPQWNCACPGCSGARAHPHWRRRHASLAVQSSQDRWYLVNATPDIGDQIEDCPALHPGPGSRRTPIAGLVLTDAELDHTLGIARLREAGAGGLELLATGAVREALLTRLRLEAVIGPYTPLTWRELPREKPEPLTADSEVSISAIPVSGKRPRYAADSPGTGSDPWVVALHLTDRATGATAVYAPALGAWPDALQSAVAEADCVIVDGTFWDDDEPRRTGISTRTATGMGHLPIDGPDGTAERLEALGGRCLYTHLNNTNPLVDPGAPQHKRLADRGIDVAADGMVINL